MAKTEEQLYASLRSGMQAAADLAVAKPLLFARREALIQHAISAYEALPARKLTELDALLFVAALVENKKLMNDLEYATSQGERAYKKLQS